MELNEKIYLEKYNPEWQIFFENEQSLIKKAINDYSGNFHIEHIGSTSILGIIAKPIVDILIGVTTFPPDKLFIENIINSGYEYMKSGSVPERLYFTKRATVSYNIQIVKYNDDIWKKDILFRDYLRSHPDKAKKYSELKKSIYDSGAITLLEYSAQKASFISNILDTL